MPNLSRSGNCVPDTAGRKKRCRVGGWLFRFSRKKPNCQEIDMNHRSAHATEIGLPAAPATRRAGARSVVLALAIAAILAVAVLMAQHAVDGAAPAATLSVIGETFDKGF
jgi:hypothetical protein